MYREYKSYLQQNAQKMSEDRKMEYNFLSPNCGLKVSAICLGAMTFQKETSDFFISSINIGKEASFKMLDRFVELGGNFIDTANVYSKGQSEEIIGEWMKERGNRRNMVIATKVRCNVTEAFNADPSKPNAMGLSRKHILDAVEDSLKRLQTDYIDLYQIHGSDDGTPYPEIVRTLDELVRCGKVRYVGACNLTGWEMQKFVEVGRQLGASPWVTLQSHYSLLGRYCEREAFKVCKNEGLGLLPWGALRGGLLTGKVQRDNMEAPKGSRLELGTKIKIGFDNLPDLSVLKQDDRVWNLIDGLKSIAKAHGKTPAQVALRWLLQTAPVTSVIIGTTKIHQLEDNCGAMGWRMTDEEMGELEKLAPNDPIYPYNLAAMMADGRDKVPAHVN